MKRNHLTVLTGLMFLGVYGYAQQVSFTGNRIPPETFFSSVTKQTGFVFFYNASLFKNASPISIHI